MPIGTVVRVAATRRFGSARLLQGLTGIIIAHHFMRGWCKLRLDPNPVTPELVWSIPFEVLQAERCVK